MTVCSDRLDFSIFILTISSSTSNFVGISKNCNFLTTEYRLVEYLEMILKYTLNSIDDHSVNRKTFWIFSNWTCCQYESNDELVWWLQEEYDGMKLSPKRVGSYIQSLISYYFY